MKRLAIAYAVALALSPVQASAASDSLITLSDQSSVYGYKPAGSVLVTPTGGTQKTLANALSLSQSTGILPTANGGTGRATSFLNTITNAVNAYGSPQNVTQSQVNGSGTNVSNGTDTVRTYRIPYYFPQYTHDIRVRLGNYGVASTTNVQTGPGNAITDAAGFECNSVTQPVTFSGQTTVSIPNAGEVVSDTIPVDIAAGSTCFTRVSVTVTGGQFWPLNVQGATGTTTYSNNLTNTPNSTGALANSAAGTNIYAPLGVYGSTAPLSSASVDLACDSIGAGTGDIFDPTFTALTYEPGFLTRGLGVNTATPRSWTNKCITGTTVAENINQSLAPGFVRSISANQYAISELGTNDYSGQTITVSEANYITLWTMYANRGIPIYQTTLLPKTNSSDRWVTIGGQSFQNSQSISAATNASPIAISLTGPHKNITGQTVKISGCTGNTAANGTWVITVTGSSTFTLNGSTGNGTYNGGSGVAAVGEANREALNDWIRTIPAPLTGVIETANVVECNASNVVTQDGGYWCIPAGTTDSGTASAGSSTTLTDSSKTWTTNQWTGYELVLTGGTGSNHTMQVTSNTATVLTFNGIGVTPDNTTTYKVGPYPTADGVHPSPLNHALLAVPVAVTAAANFVGK